MNRAVSSTLVSVALAAAVALMVVGSLWILVDLVRA